jgi:hypothetical protein
MGTFGFLRHQHGPVLWLQQMAEHERVGVLLLRKV